MSVKERYIQTTVKVPTRREIFDRYLAACPGSREEFKPTPQNVGRWLSMIRLQANHTKIKARQKAAKPQADITLDAQ